MSKRHRVLAALAAGCVWMGVAGPGTKPAKAAPTYAWQRVEPLLHYHNDLQLFRPCAMTLAGGIRSCAGLVDSHDGMSLSVSMQLPEAATGKLPVLLYLHAFASNRGEFSGTLGGWGTDFNSEFFAGKGYLVVRPAARGMGGSCGMAGGATGPHDTDGQPQLETPHGPGGDGESPDFTCSKGYTHVAEPDFEIADWQHLLGLLVDAGVADPARLGVAGWSYGGGQSWQLATSMPWLTPSGDRRIQLAAALPMVGWTSLMSAYGPNGRASDDPDQSASLDEPRGVVKHTSLVTATVGQGVGTARYNDTDPSEPDSYRPGLVASWFVGEPFDPDESARLRAVQHRKSAYYNEDYFEALQAGAVKRVPVLAVQGWNDGSFTPVETLQMYRKLKAADPKYPVSMFLADVGHGPGRQHGTAQVKAAYRAHAVAFLDSHLLRGGAGAEPDEVVSMSTECPYPAPDDVAAPPHSETVVADDWDSIHPGLVSLQSDADLTTVWAGASPVEDAQAAPAVDLNRCLAQAAGSYVPVGDYSWPKPGKGLRLLGLPKVTADYTLTGDDATVIAKLWDVAADGHRTLVTRGAYRLTSVDDGPSGTITFQLFGNHYRFTGTQVQLELMQWDEPYFKADNLPSTINYDGVRLDLPTR